MVFKPPAIGHPQPASRIPVVTDWSVRFVLPLDISTERRLFQSLCCGVLLLHDAPPPLLFPLLLLFFFFFLFLSLYCFIVPSPSQQNSFFALHSSLLHSPLYLFADFCGLVVTPNLEHFYLSTVSYSYFPFLLQTSCTNATSSFAWISSSYSSFFTTVQHPLL